MFKIGVPISLVLGILATFAGRRHGRWRTGISRIYICVVKRVFQIDLIDLYAEAMQCDPTTSCRSRLGLLLQLIRFSRGRSQIVMRRQGFSRAFPDWINKTSLGGIRFANGANANSP